MVTCKAIILKWSEVGLIALFSFFLYPFGDRWLSAAGDANYYTALFVGFGHISHGTDLLFMRGPLNFLAFPKIDLPDAAFWFAIIFNVLTGWVLLAAPWYFFKTRVPLAVAVILTIAFGLTVAPHIAFGVLYARWLLPMLLLLVLALDSRNRSAQLLISVYSGALAALQLLMVFSSGLMAAATFSVFIIICITRGQWLVVVAGIISFIIALISGWLFSAGPDPSLYSYFHESWQMSKSYGEVFARDLITGYRWMMVAALLVAGIGFMLMVWKRQWKVVLYTIMAAPLLFYFYKHGVIRHDTAGFYETIFTWGFILFAGSWLGGELQARAAIGMWRWGGFVLMLLSLMILQAAFNSNNIGTLGLSVKAPFKLVHDVSLMLKPEERSSQQKLNRLEIRDADLIPEAWIKTVGSFPVAILPQHLTLLEAYGLNWVIPPSLFSYLAVSPAQDVRDRNWYEDAGPGYLIWYPSGIDDQNIAWYQPAAMRKIAEWYQLVDHQNDMLLLKRRDQPLRNTMHAVAEGTITPEDEIIIPELPASVRMFAFIDIQLSTIGRLVSLFYRIDPAHILVTWADGSELRFRLVRENSASGLWISSPTAQGLLLADQSESEPQAVSLKLDASRWVKSLFKPAINYRIMVELPLIDGESQTL